VNEELLLRLIEQIESLTPQLWSILIRQVYADASVMMVFGVVVLLLSFYFFRLKRIVKNEFDRIMFGLLFGLLFGLFGVYLVAYAVKRFLNPEFYVIQWIVNQL
jgi:lipopolysaccharide export LptBFGC system permease protein LptF